MRDIASGLQHVHANGIVFRDVAAKNVIMDENGTAKVLPCCRGTCTTAVVGGPLRLTESSMPPTPFLVQLSNFSHAQRLPNKEDDPRSGQVEAGALCCTLSCARYVTARHTPRTTHHIHAHQDDCGSNLQRHCVCMCVCVCVLIRRRRYQQRLRIWRQSCSRRAACSASRQTCGRW